MTPRKLAIPECRRCNEQVVLTIREEMNATRRVLAPTKEVPYHSQRLELVHNARQPISHASA